MRHLISVLARLALALPLAALVPSCAAPTAPEGFTLAIQLTGVNAAAVDTLRVVIAPTMEGTSPPGHFLAPTRGTSFENGEVVISVDARGILTMNVTGAYVRAHALADASGNDPRLELELWTDDRSVHPGPQVRATVERGGNTIATGVAYLPAWPLVLGDSSQVNVPCMTGLEMMCAGL